MTAAIPPIHHAFMSCTGTTSLACSMSQVVKFTLHVTMHYIYTSFVFTGKARYIFEDNIKMVLSQAFMQWLTKHTKSWDDRRTWDLPFGSDGKGGGMNEKW